LTVPTAHIASGNPNLLITIQAPSSDKWFAVGFGSQMAGTLILVAWPYNKEVIASARLATGHSLPPPYSGPLVTVLSSNVTTETTTVELECTNCTTWSTGKLDIESTSGNFIYAYGNQEPATPNVPTSTFTQHLDHGNFNLNLKAAQVNNNVAPTITGSATKSSGVSVFGLSQRQLVSCLQTNRR
jgi:cellobiose dehydrogenase (acceptor)